MTLLEKMISLNYDEKEARALIMSGVVLVNNEKIIISSTKIKDTDQIRIKESKKWVSRGAYKLLKAIDFFNINIKDKICLDVGASTGGFTEVLIKHGAKKIYSLDSGTNQLDYKIRSNKKVVSMEKTNLKNITKEMFETKIDFICCDVSFISVKFLLDVISKNDFLSYNNNIVILIKPQFEAIQSLVEEGGFVNKKHHEKIIQNIIKYAEELNIKFFSFVESPIKGNKSKNIEYLALFRKE